MFDRLRGWWRTLPRRTALIWIGLAPLLALLLISFAWEECFFGGCPDVRGLAAYQPGGAPVLLDRHGEVFADLTPVSQEVVPLFEMPAHVAQAFLAVEDQRFYEHKGVDWRRVGGSILANMKAGGFREGFSTITMQLARNAFPKEIPGQERSTSRKFLEMRVAQEIEARYSKEEILELYLNHIYFGNRARGIEAASRQYFGVSAKELTLPQAAVLAALPKAPSHYDPRRHPRAALERRNLVLTLMEQQGRLPRMMARAARLEPLGIVPPPPQQKVESGLAPWFVEQVRRELEARFGADLYRQPLRVWTTLDSRAQRAAEEELSRQLKRVESGELGRFEGPRYSPASKPPASGTRYLQGAFVMLDAQGGDVLAWVGGRSFAQSQFDRAASARRQVGSAFKPFVYAAALQDGFVLSQPLPDTPLRVRLAGGQIWAPQNFSGRYEGAVTMRDALVRSKNVVTVRLAYATGLGDVAGVARKAGIEPVPEVPSVALGALTVSPLELTSAYSAFATLGEKVEPRMILRVEDEDGRVLWRSQPRRRKVLDPGVAYLITDVLGDALRRGTGIGALGALSEGFKATAAGKTGTTNDGADTWFVGYTPEVVAGLWIGFDRPRQIVEDATGGRLAAPVWGRVVERFYRGRKTPAPWKVPEGVVTRDVDPSTGLLVEKGCTGSRPARELFLEEMQPAAFCPGREAPPRDGFPVMRLIAAEREQQEQEKARLAQAREAEEKRRRQDAEQAEQAKTKAEKEKLAQARRDREERERLETGKAAREQVEKAEKTAKEKKQEKERLARLEAEERRLDAREAEIAREERRRRVREEREQRARDEESREETRQAARDEPAREDEDEAAEKAAPASDLSGWWEMTNRIDETNYQQYKGLRLGYRIQLEQDGNRITGRGQKWTEDGRSVASSGRTPISVSGTIDGRKVTLNFTEHGVRRSTSGGFTWTLSADRTALRGSFWSTAADTRGRSTAVRLP